MNSILNKIAEVKRLEVEQAKAKQPLTQLREQSFPPVRDFVSALKKHRPAIIAEIKKASPSKGVIRSDFNVPAIAQTFEQHGACCLSVLTDESFFQGHPDYLLLAKNTVQCPVLRKDFIIDSYQIEQSRLLGADCILLIVALLDDQQLMDFCQHAQSLEMAVLVESHEQEELDRALRLPTPLMGINNRSLHSFVTNIETTINLAKNIPENKIIISESGINEYKDICYLQNHGVQSFLIGESLMRHKNIGKKMDELLGKETHCE